MGNSLVSAVEGKNIPVSRAISYTPAAYLSIFVLIIKQKGVVFFFKNEFEVVPNTYGRFLLSCWSRLLKKLPKHCIDCCSCRWWPPQIWKEGSYC